MPKGRPNIRLLIATGLAMISTFLVLRFAGFGEGDAPSCCAPGVSKPVLAFFAVDKYPASLLFVLVTLGIMSLVFAAVSAIAGRPAARWLEPLRAYGRVPFFFYLVHLFLVHGLALAIAAIRGWPMDYLFWSEWPKLLPPAGYGLSLVRVLGAWLVVLLVLYPLCRGFGALKSRKPSWGLRLL